MKEKWTEREHRDFCANLCAGDEWKGKCMNSPIEELCQVMLDNRFTYEEKNK